MGQEYIMQKKMIRAIIALVISLIALAVFVALYIDESRRVQETYRMQYLKCVEIVISDIESYNNAEGDYDFRYRRIVADMNSVSSFAFLLKDFDEEKITINELYTVFLKYPEQMSSKLDEAHQALSDIYANLDKGYDEANALVESIELKGY
ncbi:MAG: hypothetical protein IKE53_03905 [Clostridiales bacterium]|nr:hypothetical protein [Clostridiales bacterium]